MAKKRKAEKKRRRGRPPTTGIGMLVGVRCHDEFLGRVDMWRESQGELSRPDAIRRLAEIGLARLQPTRMRSKKPGPKAADMAGEVIDRVGDESATDDQRASRKRRLLKGPKEFRDMRGDLPKPKV